MTMELQIRYPEDFPLHGLDRDAFEAKLRDALHYCFYGRKIRQLAEQIDARRAPTYQGALPLRQIADEHAFEECMTLDGCRIDDMSVSMRRSLLRSVGARIGITLFERGGADTPRLPDTKDHHATNGQAATDPPVKTKPPRRSLAMLLAAAVFSFAGTVEWDMIRPGASPRAIPAPPERPATQADDTAHGTRPPMVATVVSSTPRQTLRQLADSVPDDQHPYEVSVMVVPQEPEESHKSGDASASRHRCAAPGIRVFQHGILREVRYERSRYRCDRKRDGRPQFPQTDGY